MLVQESVLVVANYSTLVLVRKFQVCMETGSLISLEAWLRSTCVRFIIDEYSEGIGVNIGRANFSLDSRFYQLE